MVTMIIDESAAIAVAVEREAKVGIVFHDRLFQIDRHFRVFGVRQMVRVGAVTLQVEADHIEAELLQQRINIRTAQAITGVQHDLELARKLDHRADMRHVFMDHVEIGIHCAFAVGIGGGLDDAKQAGDLVAGQRQRPECHLDLCTGVRGGCR